MSKVKYVEPTRTPEEGVLEGYREDHPSYAMIAASRVSGHTTLFASEFNHQNFITIRIAQATSHRSLSRDWNYAKNMPMIEVKMSEAQWASFISTMNVGSGVPCTLDYFNGEMIPQLPEPVVKKKEFSEELKKSMAESVMILDELNKLLDEAKITDKLRRELKNKVLHAMSGISGSAGFVQDQFDEHIETQTEHMKVEVDAFITSAIQRAGLESLTGGKSPLLLANKK